MILKEDNVLMHYGVLGMKWGVRKDRKRLGGRTIKRGSTIQNISKDRPRSLDTKDFYASFAKADKAYYASHYAYESVEYSQTGSVYKNTYVAKKDIKIPSEKEAADAFVKQDPDGVADSIAKARSDIFRTFEGQKKADKVYKETYKMFTRKGEKWLSTKGYSMFNVLIGSDDFKAKSDYAELILSLGFGGVFDSNDINVGRSEAPLIIFEPSKNFTAAPPVKLTQADMELAMKAYDAYIKKGG